MSRPVPETPVDPNAPPAAALSPTNSTGSLLQSAPEYVFSLYPPIFSLFLILFFSVSFALRLEKWTVDFTESMESDKGYSFFGKGLVVTFNAAKSNVQRVTESSGETGSTNGRLLHKKKRLRVKVMKCLAKICVIHFSAEECMGRVYY
jgi:hypothetical protein